jgi:glycosyltransferase involved in cell wall biosynthesis
MARVCIVTAGHLATCPRMLKSADALAGAGHEVRVVATRHTPWAVEADAAVRRTRAWPCTVIDYDATTGSSLYATSGARRRLATAIAATLPPARTPMPIVYRAYSRVHPELVQAAMAQPADFLYGGTTGAIGATAVAAGRLQIPYAVDLEDFHSAEQEWGDADAVNGLAARVEHEVIGRARFVTTSSGEIGAEYARLYDIDPIVVHNTFPLPTSVPPFVERSGGPLKLYWFSQTIGPRRGIEDVIRAVSIAGIATELHLRGRMADGYEKSVLAEAAAAPTLRLVVHPPAAPDEMVAVCAGYHAGLAVELNDTRSHQLCLSNKALTYILAGLAVVLTDTPGHRTLAADLRCGALVYAPGDVARLASGLKRWYDDPASLAAAQRAAWHAAATRWHWEHGLERGALLHAFEAALR